MSAHRIIMPAIHAENTRRCIRSMSDEARERVILIDNTDDDAIYGEWGGRVKVAHTQKGNLGVAASWNTGARIAFADGAEFVTLCSTSMRFGRDGGADLCTVADFCAENTQWPYGFESMHGWHLITFGRRTFDEVGWFDERFWPAYYEDNDYIWRMRCAGILEPVGAPRYERRMPWVPTLRYDCIGDGHAIRNGVTVDLEANLAYYVEKWGGPPGEETNRPPQIRASGRRAPSRMAEYPGYRGDLEYPVVAR